MPKFFFDKLVKGKSMGGFLQKIGLNFPVIENNNRYTIWVHAVSVGETKAVGSLVRSLKKQYDNPLIIISSTTATGHSEAKKCLACADYHVYLPFDISWVIRPVINRIKPNLVLVVETDFWYHFLKASKEQGATIALVNGKLSKKSAERFCKLSFFSNKLFSLFDVFCIQSEHYLSRFLQLKIPRNKIVITGNLKLDDDYPEVDLAELKSWKEKIGIKEEDKVVVAGSTHSPEENLLLQIFTAIWEKHGNIKLVIVPRHPERFEEVVSLLEREKVSYIRFSHPKAVTGNEKVVLIDAMGLLRKCYQFADISIVAGSFVDGIGGHNIIEPCWYASPTLFGPYMYSQPELVELVNKYQAGLQLPLEDIENVITDLLYKQPHKGERMGQSGRLLAAESRGATTKTCEAFESFFSKSEKN